MGSSATILPVGMKPLEILLSTLTPLHAMLGVNLDFRSMQIINKSMHFDGSRAYLLEMATEGIIFAKCHLQVHVESIGKPSTPSNKQKSI